MAGWSSRTIRQTKKAIHEWMAFFVHGRAGRIRTDDPFTPSEVRYQTALQPVSVNGRAKKQAIQELASTENHEIP